MTITVDGWMILEILTGASLGAFLQGYVSEWRRQTRCGHPWCWRLPTYDYRCWKHQDDS